MRLIRSTGQNVSPSDDGRLFDQIFTDGLFADTTFAMLGANNVQIGTIYGDLCGRDFTIEQQTVAVALPEGEGETTGYIFVEIDTSAETPLSVGSALAPFTPTYEDVNVNGAVAQMIIAEYTASPVAVTSITAKYSRVSAGGIGSLAMIESSPATANHSAGSYLVYDGVLYKVRSAIAAGETLVPGTNITATTAGAELTSLNKGLMTFTSVLSVSNRATGLRGGYAYLNDHTVLVHVIGTMNLNQDTAYEFALLQGFPIPNINAALSINILSVGPMNGFASTARVGTNGEVTVSLSKSADNVYGKSFCLGGIYYVN